MNNDDSQERRVETSEARNSGAGIGPLTTVGNYGTLQEAAIAQGILNDRGIPAFVHGGESVTTMFYFGTALGGVSVQVPKDSVKEACRILVEKLPTDAIPAWHCPQCGVNVDAGFEVCWQCSAVRPEAAEEEVLAESVDEFPGDEVVNRAFRAAVIGVLICPFSLYALYLLGDARSAPRSERSRTKLIVAHVLAYSTALMFLGVYLFRMLAILNPN